MYKESQGKLGGFPSSVTLRKAVHLHLTGNNCISRKRLIIFIFLEFITYTVFCVLARRGHQIAL